MRDVETRQAILQQSVGKASAPDGLPAEIYKNSLSVDPYLAALVNALLPTGIDPPPLRAIYVVPLLKAGKGRAPRACGRPISLPRTLMKIVEGALRQRIVSKG